MNLLSNSDVLDRLTQEGWPDVLGSISSDEIRDQTLALMWDEARENMLDLGFNYEIITGYLEDYSG